MKLNYKNCSPLFMLLFLALAFSCRKESVTQQIKNIDREAYLKISKQLDSALADYKNKNNDAAYRQFLKLRNDYLALNDYSGAGYATYLMADIQWNFGDYIGSEKTAVEALRYLKKTGKDDNLTSVYTLLGTTSRKAFDYESALENYKNAIRHTTDSVEINTVRNNIASIYTDKKQYNRALELLLNVNKSKHLNTITKARVLDNIGAVYFKLNRPEALGFLKQGLELRKNIKDEDGLVASYLNFYDFYKDTNRTLASSYALIAYKIASGMKNSGEKLNALEAIVTITSGNDREKYINAFLKLNKSYRMSQSKAELKFAKIIYDDESAKAELEAQKTQTSLQDEKDRLHKLLLAMGIAFAIGIAVLIIYLLRARHKKVKVLEVYKTEKRISKKIHDELANDVFNIMSFAESSDISPAGQQKLIQDLDTIYQKTRDISRENNTIDTGEGFGTHLKEMLSDYRTDSINVMSINFDKIPWNEISGHKKITVYRVLQELMVNMKKHSQADVVAIKFEYDNKKVTIRYSDNGIGIDTRKLNYKNGLQNAENRISAIDGSLIFDTLTGGLKVNFTFPI